MDHLIKLSNNYELIYNSAVRYLCDYLEKNKRIQSLVIGISGGIDSAVVTAIANEGVKSTSRKVKVIGRSLPMAPTKRGELERSVLIGSYFCDDFSIIDLEGANISLKENMELPGKAKTKEEIFKKKVRLGNLRARIRMVQLYELAHYYEGIILSTDNRTELELGFWTLHGDVGDLGLIQNAWKTEVYGIAKYIYNQCIQRNEPLHAESIRECIKAIPTDGLGITDSDLDQLGASSYFEVDTLLINYLTGDKDVDLNHPVIQRHLNSKFKRENPLNASREILFGLPTEV